LPGLKEAGVAFEPPLPPPEPHAIQQQALAALGQTREDGYTGGLVVLATGLGKTWLAAFDSVGFHRVLFVAHREEILNQAVETFRQVRPRARIGRLSGTQRDVDADLLFASVQTLGRNDHLAGFKPDDFDYIIVDEFHHAAANTYRRIIDHFRPKFLLGLTATPDRMDGADLLGLCQENLVFEASIREGIDGGQLCPFTYFGVPDEVDYTNIPWRSGQFDPEELTAAVATEARARNALEHFRARGGRRCLGFCCSQRHADYMAAFFEREGIRAKAVHAGPSSAPRATSLEQLRDGELDVIFAVDMFNEGVDVPAIDTVLMLRPTESTIIWLQQLGRGLRISGGKDRLIVIDYIGNHRIFLMKLRGLALIADREVDGFGSQRELLEALVGDRISLPAGCEVTYDLTAIEILEQLLRPTPNQMLIEAFYRDFEERHGIRPTAVETLHAGFSPRSNGERSWLGFVRIMGGLSEAETAAWSVSRDFFRSLEQTPMTRSYKMLLLLAMMDGGSLAPRLTLDVLVDRVSRLVAQTRQLRQDLSVDLADITALRDLLVRNPIAALVEGKGTGGTPYFSFDGQVFGLSFDIEEPAAFAALFREILDWPLAQYLSRASGDVVCSVSRNATGNPILFLPPSDPAHGLAQGPLEIEVNGEPLEATVAKIAINVVRRPGDPTNRLPAILRGWFGETAGAPGRGERVRLRQDEERMILEPVRVGLSASPGPVLWERYLRPDIPPAFGLPFSQAIWNSGFVVSEPHLFLLVTLTKDGMNAQHRYADRFISDREFSWQSQNRTTQESKHGRMLVDHQARGLHVHLFVRPSKRAGASVTRFIYCGEVDFASWEGSAPITVHWHLRNRVPKSLLAALSISDS
jgi:superfamily II DNA or RNA helicase